MHVVRRHLAPDEPHQRERPRIEASENQHLGPGRAQVRDGCIKCLGERVGIGARPQQVVAARRDADQVGRHGHGQRHLLGGDLPHHLAANREVRVAKPAGLAGGYVADPDTVELVSMYVRPEARGRGVGEALVAAVARWAEAKGAKSLHLWVTEINAPARLLYQRCGFSPTPERQPLPSNPALGEIGMQRPV